MVTNFKLDFDCGYNEGIWGVCEARINKVCEMLGLEVSDMRLKATAKGFHVYITCSRWYSDDDIIIIQLLMGSDWKRELFNLLRKSQDIPMEVGNVLFEKKYRKIEGKWALVSQEKSI